MGLKPAHHAGHKGRGAQHQPVRPQYRVRANQADITATVAERLVSLRYTDEAGIEADVLELVLADTDDAWPIRVPPVGAELELSLGYDGRLARIGLFVCDEVEISGWPGEMTIRAHAAPFERSKGGMQQLQTQKSRSWKKGTKLGDLVRKIAAEHAMRAAVDKALDGIELPHLDQADESDLSFLVRIAKRYDAVVKPAAGRLVLAKAGSARSVTGQAMPAIRLTPGDVSSWRASLTTREMSGMVISRWHETRQAALHEVKVGEGEPVTRIKRYFPTEAMARAAAQAEADRRRRRGGTLSLTMPGRTDLVAEARLVLAGFREGVDGQWVITRAEHSLDDGGYSTSVEAERSNAPPADSGKNEE